MMRLIVVMVVLLMSNALIGGVLDHLKPALGKVNHTNSSAEGIDFIYTINLDQRPEKFQMCLDQLEPYGIHPYRFSAVNGWELSLEAINDIGVKYNRRMRGGLLATTFDPVFGGNHHHEKISCIGRTYFCHCLSRGAIGIILSHLSVIKDAWDSGYETIWVMEDDIDVIKDPGLILERIEELDLTVGKGNWDILFTDRDSRDSKGAYVPAAGYLLRPNFKPKNHSELLENYSVSPNLRRVGARFGAYSMIVRRCGMKKLLDFFQRYNAYFPYDMEFHVPPGMKLFTVKKDIISNKVDALSDNARPYYKKKN